MSEAEIVRLVRCPKCQNLLPELAGYSVYQCGGCGAVLTAKVKLDAKVLAEKSDEGKSGGYEKLGDLTGKEVQQNVKSSSDNFVSGSHCSNEDIGSERIACVSKEDNGVKMDKYPNAQHVSNDESGVKVDPYSSISVRKLGKPVDSVGNVGGSQGSDHISGLRREVSGQYGNARDGNEGERPLQVNFQEDGPSNYTPDSSVNNANPGEDVNVVDRRRNNGNLQKDRAELLQMMEELSDQLRRSGNLGEKMKDKSPMKRNAADHRCNKSSTSGIFNNNDAGPSAGILEGFMPDKPTISPYHDPHYFPRNPHGGRQTNGVCNPHFPYSLSDMPGYGNYSDLQMMRSSLPTSCPFEHQIPHPFYYPGQTCTGDPAICVPNSNNGLPHHNVCGFYNCCSDHHRATQPDYLDNTRFYGMHNSLMPYPPNISGPSAQRGYTRKASGLSSTLVDHSIQTRLAVSDMRHCTHGYVRQPQEKGKRAKVGLHCQPIASGAPFVLCQGCSKLLRLPKMTLKLNSKRQILCCGACNTVMVSAVINGKFTLSVSGESKKIEKRVIPHLDDLAQEGNSSELGWAKMKSVSDYFYSSSHESHAINGNTLVNTRVLDLSSNETQDSHSLPASSPDSFEGVESSENLASVSPYDLTQQDQLGNFFNANVTSRVWKGSQSTRSDHEKVMPKDMISRQNSLNETSTTGQIEEASFNIYSKTGVSQNPEPTTQGNDNEKIKGGRFAVVIKKSFKGLSRSNHSADSRDRNVTVNGCKISERLVKKAEKLAGPIQPGNYWCLLKFLVTFSLTCSMLSCLAIRICVEFHMPFNNASKVISIDYLSIFVRYSLVCRLLAVSLTRLLRLFVWYDFRAGFWGVIGGPCLGIIPPCIEEFNYPMQANCSSGATGVFVNGREVQQIDLDLLASRGLPTTTGRSYVIEISGKVVDKDSGEELDGLGKLAPTIEKVKHGFGMKPRTQVIQ